MTWEEFKNRVLQNNQYLEDFKKSPYYLDISDRIKEARSSDIKINHAKQQGIRGFWKYFNVPDVHWMYGIIKEVRPQVVVETGAAWGSFTSAILAAMAENQQGELFSIEIGNDNNIGFLVPESLRRSNWHLLNGISSQDALFGNMIPDKVDMFFHDSLHTYDHASWEYAWARYHVVPGGIIGSHDIDIKGVGNAFNRLVENLNTTNYVICQPTGSGRYGKTIKSGYLVNQ